MNWLKLCAWCAAALSAVFIGASLGVTARNNVIQDTKQLTVVIDAGHGGIDGGVVGKTTGVKESTLNLSIAKKLAEEFALRNFIVVMTRTTDEGLYGTTAKGHKVRDMEARKKIIVGAKPDIVISIHQNSFPSSSVKGPHVFYDFGNEKGQQLAAYVQETLNAFTSNSHVCKTGDYFMLKCSDSPSIIVECGFLSNREEEARLCDFSNHQAYAKAVFDGVMLYLYNT